MSQRYLILDYETRSQADLKKVGAYEYANHPSTEILCVGWRFGNSWELKNKTTKLWSPFLKNQSQPDQLVNALLLDDIFLVAHNAYFEQVITRFILSQHFTHPYLKQIPHERWICTAARAAALALPRNLEGACQALGLSTQKDMVGRRLMLKYSKPRKPTKNNNNVWHWDDDEVKRLFEYCKSDVDAETELFLRTQPLSDKERSVWYLDQRINFNGFRIDLPLVERCLELISEEEKNLKEQTKQLTQGTITNTTQRDKCLAWIKENGGGIPDLRSKTVSDYLKKKDIPEKVREILEIRQEGSKSSTKKYTAFKNRAGKDHRVRDILLYHGASTGRWAGLGVQPQNLPRQSKDFDFETAIEVIKESDLETIRLLYGSPSKLFSNCIRSVITSSYGKTLFCADYNAIEARVLFWVAKDEIGIKAFRDNRPIYKEMAAAIYHKPVVDITDDERFFGKTAVLGCGYGLGAQGFKNQVQNLGINISDTFAKQVIDAYRTKYYMVPKLWSNLEKAAIYATQNKGKAVSINYTKWFVAGKFLYCELPSGRKLAFYGPEIKAGKTPWGEERLQLWHWSTHPVTKKWTLDSTYGGMLTENVVQAIARDLMAEAMLRIEENGYEMLLSIHDELLAERKMGQGNLQEFFKLMADVPDWAKGCPVKVEGWEGFRYRK